MQWEIYFDKNFDLLDISTESCWYYVLLKLIFKGIIIVGMKYG